MGYLNFSNTQHWQVNLLSNFGAGRRVARYVAKLSCCALHSSSVSPFPGFHLPSSLPLLSVFLWRACCAVKTQDPSPAPLQCHLSLALPPLPPMAAVLLLPFSRLAIKIQCYIFTMSSSMCSGSPLSHLQQSSAAVRANHLPHCLAAAQTCVILLSIRESYQFVCNLCSHIINSDLNT